MKQKKNIGKVLKSKLQLLVMFAVPLIWYIIFCYIPMYGIQLAFRDYNPRLGYLGSPFVGLQWFRQFFFFFLLLDGYYLEYIFYQPVFYCDRISGSNHSGDHYQ